MGCLFCDKAVHGHLCCADCEPLFGKGQLDGDTWVTTERFYKHLFHKFGDGVGESSEILQRLMALRVKNIRIPYNVRGKRAILTLPIVDFLKRGIIYTNRGKGKLMESEPDRQYVLPMPLKIREQLHLES